MKNVKELTQKLARLNAEYSSKEYELEKLEIEIIELEEELLFGEEE